MQDAADGTGGLMSNIQECQLCADMFHVGYPYQKHYDETELCEECMDSLQEEALVED